MSRVQVVERAFAVLAALADGPIGVTEVADRVRLPKSTVARILRALQHEGAVEQVPGDTRYRVGERMALIAARLTPGASLASLARPTLEELAAEVGEATGPRPGRLPGPLIDQADTKNAVQARDWTGTRVPMHAVPSGQAFLAYLPAPEFARFLGAALERFTPNTITDAGELLARLDRIRARGRRLGPRGIRRGHQLGGRRGPRRSRQAGRRDPRPRPVVPLPGSRRRAADLGTAALRRRPDLGVARPGRLRRGPGGLLTSDTGLGGLISPGAVFRVRYHPR